MTRWGEAYTVQHTMHSDQARWVVRRPDGSLAYEHKLVWEEVHGALPQGQVIHHIDGNPLNNALENLEAMSRGEHTSMHLRGNMGSHSVRDGVEGKKCRSPFCCGTWKPLAEFPRNGRSKVGTPVYRPVCRACIARAQREQRE